MTIANPLAADDDRGPVGEYPDIPARSGVTAVLDAAKHIGGLQAFVTELWAACEGRTELTVTEIRDLMARCHV